MTLVKDANGNTMQLLQPSASHQAVSVSGTSAQSAILAGTTRFVELYCDTTCFVAVGANPTAVATNIPVYAGILRTLQVTGGSKIAAITAGGTDTLRIVEML